MGLGGILPGVLITAAFLVTSISGAAARGDDPAARPNDWVDGAVFYHVFVLSFHDSNGDGFGDLTGLIQKLDYLNDGDPTTDGDLGVDALRLMPVQPSVGYTGYDVLSYQAINPVLGSADDFVRLCEEAHARGMRVILDLSLNQTSAWHPWFAGSAEGPDSETRDWYVWRPEDPGWKRPWDELEPAWHEVEGSYFYGVARRSMPDLNLRNPVVVDSLLEATRGGAAPPRGR